MKFTVNPELQYQRPKIQERRANFAKEMTGYFVGPLRVESFFKDFMPLSPAAQVCPAADFSKVPLDGLESKMYQPFVSCMLLRFLFRPTDYIPD